MKYDFALTKMGIMACSNIPPLFKHKKSRKLKPKRIVILYFFLNNNKKRKDPISFYKLNLKTHNNFSGRIYHKVLVKCWLLLQLRNDKIVCVTHVCVHDNFDLQVSS